MKVGDQVMLVWACCPQGRSNIGWVGPLLDVTRPARAECLRCGAVVFGRIAIVSDEIADDGAVPLSWLRKVPPNTPMDETVTDEEATA